MKIKRMIQLFTIGTILSFSFQSALATVSAGLIYGPALGIGSNLYVKALPGASIQACVNTGTLSCNSPVQAYSDAGLTQPINPVADANANYYFFVSIATTTSFVVQVSYPGYATSLFYTIAGSLSPVTIGTLTGCNTPSNGIIQCTTLEGTSSVTAPIGSFTRVELQNSRGGLGASAIADPTSAAGGWDFIDAFGNDVGRLVSPILSDGQWEILSQIPSFRIGTNHGVASDTYACVDYTTGITYFSSSSQCLSTSLSTTGDAGHLGPATAPSGSCTVAGEWVFSQDGHATVCLSGTWSSKI